MSKRKVRRVIAWFHLKNAQPSTVKIPQISLDCAGGLGEPTFSSDLRQCATCWSCEIWSPQCGQRSAQHSAVETSKSDHTACLWLPNVIHNEPWPRRGIMSVAKQYGQDLYNNSIMMIIHAIDEVRFEHFAGFSEGKTEFSKNLTLGSSYWFFVIPFLGMSAVAQVCVRKCLIKTQCPGLLGAARSATAHHFFRSRFLHPGPAGILRCSDECQALNSRCIHN